ncbi:hypothetical protein, partial [Streptomyces rimosus]
MLGERRQFGAVGQDALEVGPVAFGKDVGVGEEPARDGVADGGRGLTGWCLPRRFLLTVKVAWPRPSQGSVGGFGRSAARRYSALIR